jgi:4-amino-4-deoxy-L-arabinose transferase-like glycosyltransferase
MSKIKHAFPTFVFIVCLVNFLIRIPFFSRLLTNDANLYSIGVLRVYQNHFNPFIQFWGYKPPVLFELTAILYKIFGPSIIVGNAVSAFASSIALWYTYLLGTHLFNKKTGVWATLMLFFFPIFSSQSLQFTDAIFITPLLLASILLPIQ